MFRCLMGSSKGCPLSPALVGLYVDRLERHLLESADIDVALRRFLALLLLYADDLIMMSTTAAGLQ